ncbi:MAG TPA: hypothetical protein VJN21_06295 [Candidatus Acidoferrales bacterium]|nr:hypothetical protein [Candidatus Acidoferrales bacterium]
MEKRLLYEEMARRWEGAYTMLSVSLNESLSFRAQGALSHAHENLRVSAELVGRFAEPLLTACQVLESKGRNLATSPSVAPLSPANFRTHVARQTAGWDSILHRVLFGSHSRFAHKLQALQYSISTLAEEYSVAAEELGSGLQTRPDECWLELDSLHYDLNTCLRETLVLLKSFLRAAPDSAIEGVWTDLCASEQQMPIPARPRLSEPFAH